MDASRGTAGPEPEHEPAPVPHEVRDDIARALGLAGHDDKFIEKMLPLICRSERMIRWMQAGRAAS
jgi:hypothetical protein